MRAGRRSIWVLSVALGLFAPPRVWGLVQSTQGPPVPMSLQLQITPAPKGPVVTWQPVANATSYTLHRWQRTGNQNRCCEKLIRSLTLPRFVDTTVTVDGTYIYRLVAHLRNGRRGLAERIAQVAAAPQPTQPTGPVATAPAPSAPASPPPAATPAQPAPAPGNNEGTATLDLPLRDVLHRAPPGGVAPTLSHEPAPAPAQPAAPASGAGPSAPPASQFPITAPPNRDTRMVPAIPVTPAAPSDGSSPGAGAPAASGRYLVTVTGLRAGWATSDDMLHRDGKGDEVFAAAFVRRYDRRTAEPLEYTNRQTMVYGDRNGFSNERALGGSLSPMGGIGDGDAIPDAQVARAMPAQNSVFPWKLWEGTLTEGSDALVISPSVWEYDGNPALFHTWGQSQQVLTNTLFLSARLQQQIDARMFGSLQLDGSEVTASRFVEIGKVNAGMTIAAALGLPPLHLLVGGASDRPIGIVAISKDATALPNTTVVLTREIIEAALGMPPLPVVHPTQNVVIPIPKPGIMVINFEDRTTSNPFDRKAFYSMILQVERVP